MNESCGESGVFCFLRCQIHHGGWSDLFSTQKTKNVSCLSRAKGCSSKTSCSTPDFVQGSWPTNFPKLELNLYSYEY